MLSFSFYLSQLSLFSPFLIQICFFCPFLSLFTHTRFYVYLILDLAWPMIEHTWWMREIKGYCRPTQWRAYYKMGSGRFLGLAWHYIEIWFISFLLPLLSSSFLLPYWSSRSFAAFLLQHLTLPLLWLLSIIISHILFHCYFFCDCSLFISFLPFLFSHSYHFRFVLLLSRLLITLKLHDPSELNI